MTTGDVRNRSVCPSMRSCRCNGWCCCCCCCSDCAGGFHWSSFVRVQSTLASSRQSSARIRRLAEGDRSAAAGRRSYCSNRRTSTWAENDWGRISLDQNGNLANKGVDRSSWCRLEPVEERRVEDGMSAVNDDDRPPWSRCCYMAWDGRRESIGPENGAYSVTGRTTIEIMLPLG